MTTSRRAGRQPPQIVEMAWDPITRIIGNLGVYTKIDFANRVVTECHSTSSLFRGYSVFMKGKDPRDAGFITSRICGICGDNHTTCSVYAQNMAYGIKPPPQAENIINLGEAAEYMFDHTLFQDNLVFVDFCEAMVKQTNPSVLARAENTEAPGAGMHGYRTIADIMRSFNPFEGDFYRQALKVSRTTREMFCLMEGRHAHPSTVYPGGVGVAPEPTLFTDYVARLISILDFIKRSVAMNDDVFDFFYEALPGYEEVGRRRILLGCWGAFQNARACDYRYETMNEWGKAMYVTPGIVVDGELLTNNLVDINLGIRILLGSSFYGDWVNEDPFVTHDPLGNPVDIRHPWNQTTLPEPGKRDFDDRYSWVMSPRWLDPRSGEHLALDTGRRAVRPALHDRAVRAGRHALRQVDGAQRADLAAAQRRAAGDHAGVEDPAVVQRAGARPRPRVLRGLRGRDGAALRRGRAAALPPRGRRGVHPLRGARRGGQLRLPRGGAGRALPPHGDQGRDDRQLPPVPADAVERQPARQFRHARTLRGRHRGHTHLRGERAGRLQGRGHHAHRAQLRPLPALWRPHVPRERHNPR